MLEIVLENNNYNHSETRSFVGEKMEIYVALVCLVVVLWLAWRRKHLLLWKNLGIPGPAPNLIFGNLLELYSKGPLKCHEEWVKNHGRIIGYFYGMKPVLLITDPHLLKNIFIKDFNKFINREPFNPLNQYNPKAKSDQNVVILPGKAWKDVRSVLTPTFTTAKIKLMSGSMKSSIDSMLKVLQQKAEKGIVFDIYDIYQRFSMDVITKTAFGVKTDVLKNPESRILRLSRILFSTLYKNPIIFVGMSFPVLRQLCFRLCLLSFTFMNRGRSPLLMLQRDIKEVMEMRRRNPETQKNDLLQLLLNASVVASADVDVSKVESGNEERENRRSEDTMNKKRRILTDAEIESTAFTVLLAGFETTAATLAYATYFLAKHRRVQENLFLEISDVIERGQQLDFATINKLSYLDKILSECLRLFPVACFFTNRFAVEDVQYGDLHIPKGTLIQAPSYLMHHDPEFWSDPERFDPERFSIKPNTEGITYFPFGVGPRNCLGMRYAQLKVKLALVNVVYRFNILLDEAQKDNLEVKYLIRGLKPAAVRIKLESRNEES